MTQPRVAANIVFLAAGSLWATALGFLLVPFYIDYLGIEAYGLVGFFFVLQGILPLFDFGLSPTLTRELARQNTTPDSRLEMRTTIRSLEAVNWAASLSAGVLVFLATPLIASHWLKDITLDQDSVHASLRYMGLVTVFQLPANLYAAGLIGRELYGVSSGVSAAALTLRAAGALPVIWLAQDKIMALFQWYAFATALQTAMLRFLLFRGIPRPTTPQRSCSNTLKSIAGFAAGCSASGILQNIITSIDGVLASNWMPLPVFACYSLASSFAKNMTKIMQPVSSGLFPRLVQLIAQNNNNGLTALFHRATEFMALLMIPMHAALITFSAEFLTAWTGRPDIRENAATTLAILLGGSLAMSLTTVPAIVLVAAGQIKVFLPLLSIGCLFITIVSYAVRPYLPNLAPAIAWAVWHAIALFATAQILFKHRLHNQQLRWLRNGITAPLLASLSCCIGLHLLHHGYSTLWTGRFSSLLWPAGAFAACSATSILFLPEMRAYLRQQLTPLLHPSIT